MKEDSLKMICLGGLLAALYVVLTAVNPIGYGIIQLRISAAICVLPFFRSQYKMPCIAAVAIANVFSPLGLIDVAAGIILWGLAYYSIAYIQCGVIGKCILTAILSGIVVGTELSLILGVPFLFNLISITLSQAIVFAIGIVLWTRLTRARVI